MEIEKNANALVFTCNKDGYAETVVHTDSSFDGWTAGNIIFGGIIGLAVDAASGAINEYPSQVVLTLKEL